MKKQAISIHKANNVKIVGVAIIIISIALAVILGFVAGNPTQEYLDYLRDNSNKYYKAPFSGDETTFNFELFFAIFLTGALSSTMFFVIGAMIERQNVIIGILIQLYRGTVKKEEDTDEITETDYVYDD